MTTRPPTMDVLDILLTAGVGVTLDTYAQSGGWPIAIGSEPDRPNEVITLYDIPGSSPNPKWLLDYPRFQVRVRSTAYDQAYQKIEEIKSQLLGLPSQDIGDIRYVGIWVVTDTHFLQADNQGRSIFVNSWRTIREPSQGEHRKPL